VGNSAWGTVTGATVFDNNLASTKGVALAAQPRSPRRTVLADETYAILTSQLMEHRIAPGARINIDQLARELGVSQTPIREALARLESDRLVTKEPLRGYSATSLLSLNELEDLYEFRLVIEPWAAGVVALKSSPTIVQALERELQSCPSAPTNSSYEVFRQLSDHDARFHTMILEFTGNQEMVKAFTATHCHLHQFRLHYSASSGSNALQEHRRVVNAIASADSAAAIRAMTEHLEHSRLRYVDDYAQLQLTPMSGQTSA
jgi:DNA-binding GntR family transcriptional regulator